MKWEYKIVTLKSISAEAEVNELGAQGWELISLSEFSSTYVRAAFKRQLASDKPFMAGL